MCVYVYVCVWVSEWSSKWVTECASDWVTDETELHALQASDEGQSVLPLLEAMAEQHPQALYYQFKISSETLRDEQARVYVYDCFKVGFGFISYNSRCNNDLSQLDYECKSCRWSELHFIKTCMYMCCAGGSVAQVAEESFAWRIRAIFALFAPSP